MQHAPVQASSQCWKFRLQSCLTGTNLAHADSENKVVPKSKSVEMYDWSPTGEKLERSKFLRHGKIMIRLTAWWQSEVQNGECHQTMNALMNWPDIFKIRTISTAKHWLRRLSPSDNGLVVVNGQPTVACSQHQFCFTCVHDVLITVEALTEFSEQKCLQALAAK